MQCCDIQQRSCEVEREWFANDITHLMWYWLWVQWMSLVWFLMKKKDIILNHSKLVLAVAAECFEDIDMSVLQFSATIQHFSEGFFQKFWGKIRNNFLHLFGAKVVKMKHHNWGEMQYRYPHIVQRFCDVYWNDFLYLRWNLLWTLLYQLVLVLTLEKKYNCVSAQAGFLSYKCKVSLLTWLKKQ